ncbi:Os08g0405400 [Oryza sativa Japonica Group]|uniref:Os08g0405400 protein n=1 Tax=Oryza sativa subsp. japonica TaxID=39947 RepID=A0A0P0XFE5_ORYSJ|nr:Os08g0405400 [Oryza sativa Japonica Group]
MAREVLKVLEAGLAEIALELGILLEAGRGKVEEVGTSMVDGNQMLVPMAEKMAGLDRRILEILKPVPLPFCQFPPVPAGGGGTSLLAAGSGLAQFGGVAAQLGGGMIAGGVAQGSTAAQHGVGLTGAGAQTSSDSGGNGSVLAGISPFGDNVHLPGGVGGDQHLTAVGETGVSIASST